MRISSKGQVTIPQSIREQLGLLPNTEVEFIVEGNTVRIEVEDLEQALPPDLYRRDTLPYEAAFLDGKCFLAYRRRKGTRVIEDTHVPLTSRALHRGIQPCPR